jgi:hypothetical protein
MSGLGRLFGLLALDAAVGPAHRDAEWRAALRRPEAPPLPEPSLAKAAPGRELRPNAAWAGGFVARLAAR